MDGVTITPLKRIYHPKGDIFHVIKKSDREYTNFGEAYFTIINKGEIKGWKKHTHMKLNLVVPVGSVEFVIYDEVSTNFQSVILSPDNYQRLTVQNGLWVSFRGIGDAMNLVLNIASIEHDPGESVNCELEKINYAW